MPVAATRTEWVDRLDGYPAFLVWAAIAACGLALRALDDGFPGVGLGPLYLPVLALATWRFGVVAGCIAMLATVAINIGPMIRDGDGGEAGMLLARGLVRMSAFAFTIAIVWGSRRVFDRERARARLDALTGVANRRSFVNALDAALRPSRDGALLLAVMDLDGFKAVNDAHGHAAGDEVLTAFAAGAVAAIRADDAFGRLGGDEFALFVRVPGAAEAHALARDLHARLSACCAGMACPVGVSMGALVVPADTTLAASEGLSRADRLLYDAKRSGKRVVRIDEATSGHVPPPLPDRRYLATRGCGATFSAMPFGMAALSVSRAGSASR